MINKITAAIAALLVSAGVSSAQINVGGTGTVTAKPDMAYVTLSVVSEGLNAADATKENTSGVTALCAAVEGVGIKKEDIAVSGFSVSPRYVYPKDGEPKISGYVVTNSLSVTVRDLKVLGTLLDKAVVGGSNRVPNVRYDVKEKKALYEQARKNAVADAKAKAELYAVAGGVKLKALTSITENHGYDEGVRSEGLYSARAASADRAPVPVAPGELNFSITIQASWSVE